MKTVWILGAGASIGHSKGRFPSINHFFSKAKTLGITINENNNFKNDFSNIREYIKDTFGKDILKEDIEIDIEKIMTYLNIDNEKSDNPRIRTLKQELLDFIRLVLDKLSDNLSDKVNEYNIMVEKLNDSDSIITFNWDLLLDNILGRKAILKDHSKLSEENKTQYYRTNLDFSAHGENTLGNFSVSPPYSEYDKNAGYYLKLHGSIDWLYCANKSCKAHAKVFPILNHQVEHYCSVCHEKMEYLIIPPVLNKKYNMYPYIKRIWNKATKEMDCQPFLQQFFIEH